MTHMTTASPPSNWIRNPVLDLMVVTSSVELTQAKQPPLVKPVELNSRLVLTVPVFPFGRRSTKRHDHHHPKLLNSVEPLAGRKLPDLAKKTCASVGKQAFLVLVRPLFFTPTPKC
jgi:hypothetical protein